ncbi:MAG: RNA polymerase sigma factor, partial [Bacillota bacterium]
NLIIDHYRKNKDRETVSLDGDNEIEVIDEKQSAVKSMELKTDLLVLETKLPELKDEYREVIILRFVNELSIKEIAEITGLKETVIKNRLYRGRKALKEILLNEGFTW